MTIKIMKFSSEEEQSKIHNYLILPLIDGKFTPISDVRITRPKKIPISKTLLGRLLFKHKRSVSQGIFKVRNTN